MSNFRAVTNERRWVRCSYEVIADDVKEAIRCVEEDGIEPCSIGPGDGDFDSDDVQFLSVVPFEDDPRATAAQEHAAIQARMGRSKPVETPIDNPEPKG